VNTSALLSVRSLSKTYRVGLTGCTASVRALDDVSLEIARGEVVAVVGPARGGKTTLLRCVSGLLTPDAGLVSRAYATDGLPVVVKYLERPVELVRLCGYDSIWDLALVDNVNRDEGEMLGACSLLAIIREVRTKGAALVLASSAGQSLEGFADRVLTLHRGRLLASRRAKECSKSSRRDVGARGAIVAPLQQTR
jgi:ABC-type multidrug transport system ATPase subunit